MKSLNGTKTHTNLKEAFAGESQANRRYLYFANKADVEGQNDVAAVFRSTAEGETGHAHGHLDYLAQVGDPATGLPIGATRSNLKAAIAGETHEYTDMYPGMAKAARERGLRRDRRLVRDAGESRALARESFPEGAGRPGRLGSPSRARSVAGVATLDARSRCAPRCSGAFAGRRSGPARACQTSARSCPQQDKTMTEREGNLQAPTRHPLDWRNPEFYDDAALDKELERVFDICHGCRRCVSLCQSFPTLFDLVDNSPTMEVDGVAKEDYAKVVDQCYLCDLCYMTKCPYVPPHPWNVDFPHLMLRAKAAKFKKQGATLRDRVLTSTDRVGRLATIPVVAQIGQQGQRDARGAKADGQDDGHRVRRDAADLRQRAVPRDGRRVRWRSRSGTARGRRARSRSSRRATSTTSSRESATICSRSSRTTRSRTRSSRRRRAAGCRSSSSAISSPSRS